MKRIKSQAGFHLQTSIKVSTFKSQVMDKNQKKGDEVFIFDIFIQPL